MVFYGKILENLHELDRTNITGKILITLLCKELNVEKPKGTEELAEIYYIYNLLIDSLSNMVLCKNINGKINNKNHPEWNGFVENNEAMQITLLQLSKLDEVVTKLPYVIIVENPAVFSMLAEFTNDIGLVCTYGQVKLSGIILLNLLIKSNVKLFYSGDIDPEGILIADKLKQRYKENITLVGFGIDTYFKNMSNVNLNKVRLKKLDNVTDSDLVELSTCVNEYKKAAYEEKNLETLLKLVEKIEKGIEDRLF